VARPPQRRAAPAAPVPPASRGFPSRILRIDRPTFELRIR